jgi:hypothetical protein
LFSNALIVAALTPKRSASPRKESPAALRAARISSPTVVVI